ncbi:YqaA family protein [Natronomonas sp.]|uniref:YqaA family protein n=1 Tax=Natronomonas sp. TaxID=2184060 RepID=UPI00398A126F
MFAFPTTHLISVVPASWEQVQAAVETASGWPGLGIIFTYSFLIAFLLPGPSEIVLAAPLDIGLGYAATLVVIILVSAFGKTAGSLVAFRVGQGVKNSDPVLQWLARRGINVVAWSERQAVRLAKRYGYLGLAIGLSVPFFPDTVSIYAFTVIEEHTGKFALATFLGSIGRFIVTLVLIGGPLALF